MEDYYEYLDSNGVTTLYKLIKDDTVALINGYSVTLNNITTNLDNHVNNTDIHTPISDIENMIDTKVSGLVNSAPETLDTLKELSDALGNDPNFATTVANQIGNKADKDSVYTKLETDTLLESKANSVHNHVVSDITDMPTIPTKTSELTNDSGYITNVTWEDVIDKPKLSQVAISGSYSDLNNTPTIPTKTSQLINDSGFLTSSSGVITSVSWSDITNKPNFSTVATSGSYNDLSNKPTIPNVYNKTLTIQKNGTNVATFTSNSNTDVIANITVPTKVSELSNDSGFITGISWDKVTNKPTLATVATSGSYTDLSNTPTIPTKVSQLENDTGFINTLTDVVDTKSNQTINGTKTFSNGPWVINSQNTTGFSIKNTAIARNDIPTEYQHYTFRAYDKNNNILGEYCIEKTTYGEAVLNMGVRSEDSSGTQIAYGMQFRMTNDGSVARLIPSANNKVHLGDVNAKWLKVHSDDVVHTSGDETIAGNKTFSNRVSFPSGYYMTTEASDNSLRIIRSGSGHGNNYKVIIQGDTGKFFAPNGFIGNLQGNADTATSANDPNAVHKSGNETINGVKSFNNLMYIYDNMSNKNSQMDLFKTPANTLYSHYMFVDKNNEVCAYTQYGQQHHGNDFIGLFIHDKNRALHGIQVTTNNEVIPISNNTYGLGTANNKWANVYATAFNGNLKGNADTATSATKASYLDNYSNVGGNKIYLDWDKQVKGYVGLKVDNTVMGGLITTKNIGSQAANSATYATTQATTDNSTKIATTAWVRTYVNSVAGNNTVGSSVSAYWSNSSLVTATGQSSSGGYYPECYSEYVSKTPVVGTIYSGAQLYTVLNTYASATGSKNNTTGIYFTSNKAQATLSNPLSSTAKYLCTTANTFSFRAYTARGNTSSVGTSSVVNATLTKSIFIRVQ